LTEDEPPEPDFWERLLHTTTGMVCCREHRPLHSELPVGFSIAVPEEECCETKDSVGAS